jgi:hypothetical protein
MKRNVQNHKTRGYIYMPRTAILSERIERLSEAERFSRAITFAAEFQIGMEKLR